MSPSRSDHVHLNEPWLSIQWDGEYRCIYAEFKAFANSTEFRAGAMKMLEVIRERHCASMVSDNRRLEGVASEDQLWLRDTWVPLAAAAGLERVGVVLAHHGLGRIASEQIISQIGPAMFATRTFTTVSEAMEWVSGA